MIPDCLARSRERSQSYSRYSRVASVRRVLPQLPPFTTNSAIRQWSSMCRWTSEKLIPWFEERLRPLRYRAVPNMPRAYPHEASAAHGDVITPYLATLLYLTARYGGPLGALRWLRKIPIDLRGADPLVVDERDVLSALLQDLRNGLAVCPTAQGLEIADTMPAPYRSAIQILLEQAPVPRR